MDKQNLLKAGAEQSRFSIPQRSDHKVVLQKAKHALLLFLILVTFSVKGQDHEIEANGRTYEQIFDSLSTGLIKSRIPYGVLLDRVPNLYSLQSFSDGGTVSGQMLKQVWWEMEHADVRTVPLSNLYDAMHARTSYELKQKRLPVLAVTYDMAILDSPALEDGRLSVVNGILTDNNLPAIPYVTKKIKIAGIAAPTAEQHMDYTLSFRTANILNNTSANIVQVTITDVTEENTRYTLRPGDEIPINFNVSGEHTLNITIDRTDGTASTLVQKFQVAEETLRGSGPCSPVHRILQSSIPFQGYDETEATTSNADYHIYYHYTTPTSTDCETVIRKPIIIPDGFDPEDTRSYDQVYSEYLVDQFGVNFGESLRRKGYDIIIINFPVLGSLLGNPDDGYYIVPTTVAKQTASGMVWVNKPGRDGGADFIERNAMLMVKLIQTINAEKVGSEKLVVIGASMGGQISRYALAYMEKQNALGVANMNHDTRVWISFDSPHLGANIPLSMQQTLSFYGNAGGIQDAKDKLDKRLLSKAAKQLLIEQMGGLNNTAPFRQTYITNLTVNNGTPGSDGWPVNLRKISLINGSGAGIKTHAEGNEILRLKAEAIWGIDAARFNANLLAAPSSSGQTFKGFILIKNGFLNYSSITQTISVYNGNSRGSMDVLPGGTYDVQGQIKDGFQDALSNNSDIKSISWQTYLPLHCFIPAISSLAFKSPSFDWNTRVDDRNLVCNNETYFDGYYTPAANERHVSLTDKSVAWALQEVDYGKFGCPVICSRILNGVNSMCLNINTTYTLDAPPPAGATVAWSVSPGLTISSYNNSSVTVSGSSNTSGGWIKVVITPTIGGVKCGADVEISKTNIFVGIYEPAPPTISITNSPTPSIKMVYVTFPTPPTGTTYNWTVTKIITGACVGCHKTGTNAGTEYFQMTNGQKISYTLSATNSCGSGYIDRLYQLVVTSNSAYLNDLGALQKTTGDMETDAAEAGISVYPNPSDKDWMLSVINPVAGSMKVSLHDMTGKELMRKTYDNLNGDVIPISNSGLNTGMYLLYVETEKKVYQYKLIKE